MHLIFMKETKTSLTQFWLIIYKTGKFSFHENNRNFIDSVLGNHLHNW